MLQDLLKIVKLYLKKKKSVRPINYAKDIFSQQIKQKMENTKILQKAISEGKAARHKDQKV